MQRLLVIGGLGFLGSEVVSSLRAQGDAHVTVLDLNWFGAPVPPGVTLLQKDAWEISPMDMAGQDAVILLAGLANDQIVEADLARNFKDHAALPAYLGLLAKRAGVRNFVFSSTTSLYESEGDDLGTEEDVVAPQSPASVVKLQAETALRCWEKAGEFDVFIFRMGTICGWSARPRLDLVINAMCLSALKDGKITVRGEAVWRSIVGVGDAGHILAEAALGKMRGSGTFNLVENQYTLGELAAFVKTTASRLGLSVAVENLTVDKPRNFRASNKKIRAAFPRLQWKTPDLLAQETLQALMTLPKEAWESDKFFNYAAFSGRSLA